jgi:hypothetical protein
MSVGGELSFDGSLMGERRGLRETFLNQPGRHARPE